MIDQSKGGDIPVRSVVINETTDEPNGTIVTIGKIELARINTPAIIDGPSGISVGDRVEIRHEHATAS
jgi:hypothetical protein